MSEQTIRARVSRGLRSLGATLERPMTEHAREPRPRPAPRPARRSAIASATPPRARSTRSSRGAPPAPAPLECARSCSLASSPRWSALAASPPPGSSPALATRCPRSAQRRAVGRALGLRRRGPRRRPAVGAAGVRRRPRPRVPPARPPPRRRARHGRERAVPPVRGAARTAPAATFGVHRCSVVERRVQPAARTIVFGITRSAQRVRIRIAGRDRLVAPKALGAYLAVYEGRPDLTGASVTVTVDGRRSSYPLGR